MLIGVKLGMSLMLQLCQVPSLVPQPCQAVLFILVLLLTIDTHNVNIFDNKKEVADRIILKIESYFGTHCRDCDSPYRNYFQSPTPPLLACYSCFQGSHDCETIKEKAEALEKLVCDWYGLVMS